jgi:hypothetical protein
MPRNDKELDELPTGKIKMGRKFFENMRNRIETIRPEAGTYISVTAQTGYGFKISANFNVVTINVCSGGAPFAISVLTEKPKANT